MSIYTVYIRKTSGSYDCFKTRVRAAEPVLTDELVQRAVGKIFGRNRTFIRNNGMSIKTCWYGQVGRWSEQARAYSMDGGIISITIGYE